LQLRAQQVLIPPGVLRDAVVGQDARAALRVREVLKHDARHTIGQAEPAELLGRQTRRGHHATVPGDDRAGLVDQHRVRETELEDRREDLRDLRRRVRARVAHVGHKGAERAALEPMNRRPVTHYTPVFPLPLPAARLPTATRRH
jgi:hypothetical protein